jgi:hypothetical protein
MRTFRHLSIALDLLLSAHIACLQSIKLAKPKEFWRRGLTLAIRRRFASLASSPMLPTDGSSTNKGPFRTGGMGEPSGLKPPKI